MTLAGLSTIVPVAAGAVGIGVLTGSRRRGVNFFTSTFSQLLLATSGVHLNVIGKENLTAQRPAVFIFNHRNQVDPVIAGALVRDNWVGVGKKELASDPIMGTLGSCWTVCSSTVMIRSPRWRHCTRLRSAPAMDYRS